jgi:DNA-binding transcriptional regulator YiaG
VTPEAFRAALQGLHMTQAAFARALPVNPRTVRRWAAGECPVPTTVVTLLHALAKAHAAGGVIAVRAVLQK